MKKIIGMVLALVLLVNLAVPAGAESKEYEMPEVGLSLTVPSEYDVFYRNMREDDPLFSDYGLSKEEALEILGSDIYLDALDPQGNEEVVVTYFEDMMLDINGLGDTMLQLLAASIAEEYETSGFQVFSTDVYHHSQLDFLCIYFYIPEENTYVLQYYTIYDGNGVSIALRSYIGGISDAQEKRLLSIVDSITVDSYTPVATQGPETPAFTYTDSDTGTTFTIPANWTEQSLSKEREYLDVAFSFAADPGLHIMYGSNDFSSELSFLEKQLINQQGFGEEICAGIAEEMGIPESSVWMETYNGKDYYFLECPYTSDEYGLPLTLTITQAMHMEKDGWVYFFQITGKPGDQYYGELEKVLESVEYGGTGAHSSDSLVIGIISVVVLILLILFIFVFRAAQKSRKEEGNPADVYCPCCGKRMPGDSRYCDGCGARLTRREGEL